MFVILNNKIVIYFTQSHANKEANGPRSHITTIKHV